MNLEQVVRWLESQRNGKSVVLVTGVFDLLHQEHIHFLQKAKALADILVIGIESDLRVKQLKGENRPIWNQDKRQAKLLQLHLTDGVFILPEQFSSKQDHENLIAQLKPNFLAVSSHTLHQEQKKELVEKYGGQLKIVLEHNPEVSTTQRLQQD
jgi:rfaE bifunctional protein nucleotidyltransferase chain/domain